MNNVKGSWRHKLAAGCLGSLLAMSGMTTAVQADDTEVFFGQLDPSLKIFPNVLFVLDTSGSMSWSDPGEGQDTPRIIRLKAAMNEILDSATNINVGIMRFNGSSGGGPVLYPVTYIDEAVCESTDCGQVNLVSRINQSENDAKQFADGSVVMSSSILQMQQAGGSLDTTALRFPDLQIPSGATITSAVLELTSFNDTSTSNELVISAESSGDSEQFTTAADSINSRARTSNSQTWTNANWAALQQYQTPDLKTVIQEVVDHADWCGGNALSLFINGTGGSTGLRNAIAFDYSPNEAPLLKISYDSTSIGSGQGCMQAKKVYQVSRDTDDAEEFLSNNKVNRNSSDLELAHDSGIQQLVGMRFRNVTIPAGVEVTDAYLEFQIDEYKTGNVTLNIWGESKDNPRGYAKKSFNISNRSKSANSVQWINPPELTVGQKLKSEKITPIVQELVNRSGWQAGNSMAFMIGHSSGAGTRTVESYKGRPTEAPRLHVSYKVFVGGSTATYITARDKMKNLVNNLTVKGGTPIVDALYEASLYYRGAEVDYGLKRGYYTSRYHRVSNPLSYTGGSVSRHADCSDANLDASACESERIENYSGSGVATYISPIESSCQTNQIVLLSDGEPTSNSSAAKVHALMQSTATETVPSCTSSGNERCGVELAEWLNQTDHSSSMTGKQNITTYTIGMNLNSAFLDALAEAGGSMKSRQASSSQELVTVFNNILGEVLTVDTSFVAPGATVNQFNRLTHRNDIYFSLFKPAERPTWQGNLKKYSLHLASDGNVRVFDNSNPPKLAVDQQSGFFADGTQSYWSDQPDGNSVSLGGAAHELSLGTLSNPRKVYTYTGSTPSNVALNSSANFLHESNKANVTRAVLGIDGQSEAYHEKLLKWARGVDVNDIDGDGDTSDIRKHMGDPMHSRPLLINYATSSATPDSTIYISTNEGFLHALEHVNGTELFSFIPKELLPNLDVFYRNTSIDSHPYGLDGSLSSWINDINDNTVVDPGESAHLYMGMRRGGRNYYSMDVTDRNNPRLNWVIKGGSTGFEQLGQTWSKMIPTKLKVGGDEKTVLVFGGGYDINQDPPSDGSVMTRSVDNIGRAIFIVDAETGQKLWTGSGFSANAGTGEHTYFPDMKYSIPSDLRVVDIDFDGFADQLYFGDMGGQVWRLDINQGNNSDPLVNGGVLADFAKDGDPTQARRFFYEPDVALLSDEGERYLAISIGSGWRSHPLDDLVQDEFYMLRTRSVYSAPDGYGKVDDPSVLPHTYSKITSSDLVDITDDMNAEINWESKVGWKLRMTRPGEKVLSDSITVNNQVVFTSYVPQQATAACTTAVGGGRVYVVDVRNGKPRINLDGKGEESNLSESDRSKELVHGGIPPEPAALFTEEGNPIILVGPEQPLDDINLSNAPVRTYWREQAPDQTAGVQLP